MEIYTKPPLGIEEQLTLLKKRGLIISDDTFAYRVLSTVEYYRLTAYLYPFRDKTDSECFISGTTLDKVWRFYRFDRKLRLLVKPVT